MLSTSQGIPDMTGCRLPSRIPALLLGLTVVLLTLPAAANCPLTTDQCVARCVGNGRPQQFCAKWCGNRACLKGHGAAKGGIAKRGGERPAGKQDGPSQGKRSPAQPLVGEARQMMQGGRFREAVTLLDKAEKLDPKWPGTYAWRGTAKNRLGQARASIPDYDKALQLDPKNYPALTGRGAAWRALGELGRALADLNAASEIEPSAAEPYAFRALAYSNMGDQQTALKQAETAVQLNPNSFSAQGSLGYVLNILKRYDAALPPYDKALQIYPHHFQNLAGRGVAYLNLGEPDRAFTDFDAAVRISPNYVFALVYRGRILAERREFDAAIKDLSRAVELAPKNLNARLSRAKTYELSEKFDAAIDDYATILTIFPTHGVATAGVERNAARSAAAQGQTVQRPQRPGSRVALVIGNSKYGTMDNLRNAERDATLVSETLRRLGFEKVELAVDTPREKLVEVLKAFTEMAAGADWAVVYYAGHGIEFDGSNYLLPTDVKFAQDADIPIESVALDQVLNAVQGAQKLRLVILDACRENPFATDMKRSETSNIGKGLARIEPESGTLVAFATKHGKTASDGAGENSPFATALAGRMTTPGLEVNQLFRLVHDEVQTVTAKQQEPFTYGQLSAQQFYFRAQ